MTAQTRICVIDDSALVRDALAISLDDEGDFDVFIAPDGAAGLALIERVRPDVVLTDLKMPGLDGQALIAHLRARFPALPIVAMSGQTTAAALDGADAFLRKPFTIAAVRAAIAAAVQRHRRGTTGAETLPQGANEAYLHITQYGDKRYGSYSSTTVRAEWEHGFTDRLSGAIYLNGYRHDYNCGSGCAGPVGDEEIAGSLDQFALSGLSLEAKYMLLSPYQDAIGLSLYGEMSYDTIRRRH